MREHSLPEGGSKSVIAARYQKYRLAVIKYSQLPAIRRKNRDEILREVAEWESNGSNSFWSSKGSGDQADPEIEALHREECRALIADIRKRKSLG